jgi:hypothetical protein
MENWTISTSDHLTDLTYQGSILSPPLKPEVSSELTLKLNQIQHKQYLSLPFEHTRAILQHLASFELGCYLLLNGRLNGYWLSDVVLNTKIDHEIGPLEQWLRFRSPYICANRERFHTFQLEAHRRMTSNTNIASIPCGLMDDLLRLNYQSFDNIHLWGIDSEDEALAIANGNALNFGLENFTTLLKRDLCHLQITDAFDIVLSYGHNKLPMQRDWIVGFYQQIHLSLKSNGTLITAFHTSSTLTPSNPSETPNLTDSLLEHVIFNDILESDFTHSYTLDEATQILTESGFKILEIQPDSRGILPTLICQKIEK